MGGVEYGNLAVDNDDAGVDYDGVGDSEPCAGALRSGTSAAVYAHAAESAGVLCSGKRGARGVTC